MTSDFSYLRYLEAKRSVDDRALNRVVVDELRKRIPKTTPLRILEIGGGTGSMVRRCLSWSLVGDAEYVLVDEDPAAIAGLPSLLMQWSQDDVNAQCEQHDATHLRLELDTSSIDLHLAQAEIVEFLANGKGGFDLIIANAVLDLVDLRVLLPQLWAQTTSGALYWFTINFDGESIFLPKLAADEEIFEEYHASMDRRTGSRYTGRSLFGELHKSGATVVESGSSDWVVHGSDARYRSDEAYFLRHIIHTIEQELADHPGLDPNEFKTWVATRYKQVDRGELVYIAHQLDFVGTTPEKSRS